MKNLTNVHIALPSELDLDTSLPWHELCLAVREGELTKITKCFYDVLPSPILQDQMALNLGILKGLGDDSWDDAVAEFGQRPDVKQFMFVGPMRAMERKPASLGLLAACRTPNVKYLVDIIENNLGLLGSRLFGTSLDFHGRHIEFYDIGLIEGPFRHCLGQYISLFSPFYFSGWNDISRQKNYRRSILFHNIIKIRFKNLTSPLLKMHFTISGAPSILENISEEQLDQSFALWLTLHELIHGAGPIPLFGASVKKIPLGLEYAGIEEFRVDMSVWILLELCKDLFGELVPITQELILAERLLRSFRGGYWVNSSSGGILTNSDAENGLFWFSCLFQNNIIELNEVTININKNNIYNVILNTLDEIYKSESNSSHAENGQECLLVLANNLRKRYLKYMDGEFIYTEFQSYFNRIISSYPTHLNFSSAF
ncbi:hypothetical protein FE394_13435 [Xenorhabdus sp. Reich]|uniref:Uncharacterized protein n=1 Tax=Xenorhabdus littoralis TaxID=2582835 RepID=A0ABU4SNE3_9GAMM|nr:hypothetical protein [Xenorhabdus sp. Reich]MDX8000176.1 hypothetical protein [Xenorhabdus sp. Reich]